MKKKMQVLGVIPARYSSTRFPGKPLASIAGKPMIQHVYERAKKASTLNSVLVATDDERILSCVESFGGSSIMTLKDHQTGTDRLAEVANFYPEFDVIVNIQGDEPLIDPETIDMVVNALVSVANKDIVMASAMTKISEKTANDPNVVKVVTDNKNMALYFSRSKIPFLRGNENSVWQKHIGLYAYKYDFLLKYAKMESTYLENIEKLEQLRALENGYKIAMVDIENDISIGVDTPEDLKEAERLFKKLK